MAVRPASIWQKAMDSFYAVSFGALAALAAVFELTKPKEGQMNTSQDFLRFRFNYVVVYSLMMGAYCPGSLSG